MKRFQGLINRTKSLSTNGPRSQTNNTHNFDNAPADSPEANAGRAIRLFCESGSASNGGEEVLHLPVIVESAESSPVAAASAAYQIRKFLSKEYNSKPHVQYNAIMLIRILSDNPGPSFTRNFDKSFVSAVKDTLRSCKDPSTQQILRETLDALEADKQYDEGLQGLFVMWRKEKGQSASLGQRSSVRMSQQPRDFSAWQQGPGQQFGENHRSGGRSGRTTLPSPAELASRVEEARNTAKILLQLVQSTRTEEVLNHELIREFSERCQGAQRSMQGYINCDNPAPDHDTMQTLIETNEQLSLALSRHQRAVLAARRALGASDSPAPAAPTAQENGYGAFAPPPNQNGNAVYNQTPAFGGQQQQAPTAPVNGFGASVVPQDNRQSYEGYQAPEGPPPSMMNNLNQRSTQPQQSWQQQPTNPFADPVEHNANPAPLAIEPTNYGAGAFSPPPQHSQAPSHQRPTSGTFNIEPEPTFAPSPPRRQNTADLENAYSDSEGRVSPIMNRSTAGPPSEGLVSPQSPPRPGPGPWHNSEITPSYMGRQASALNGLTMHGAQSDDNVPEIDGHSQVGRGAGSYDVSPVETRTRRY